MTALSLQAPLRRARARPKQAAERACTAPTWLPCPPRSGNTSISARWLSTCEAGYGGPTCLAPLVARRGAQCHRSRWPLLQCRIAPWSTGCFATSQTMLATFAASEGGYAAHEGELVRKARARRKRKTNICCRDGNVGANNKRRTRILPRADTRPETSEHEPTEEHLQDIRPAAISAAAPDGRRHEPTPALSMSSTATTRLLQLLRCRRFALVSWPSVRKCNSKPVGNLAPVSAGKLGRLDQPSRGTESPASNSARATVEPTVPMRQTQR